MRFPCGVRARRDSGASGGRGQEPCQQRVFLAHAFVTDDGHLAVARGGDEGDDFAALEKTQDVLAGSAQHASTAATTLRRCRLLGRNTLALAAMALSRAACDVRDDSTTMGRPRSVDSRRMRAMSWKPSSRGISSAVSARCGSTYGDRGTRFAAGRALPLQASPRDATPSPTSAAPHPPLSVTPITFVAVHPPRQPPGSC